MRKYLWLLAIILSLCCIPAKAQVNCFPTSGPTACTTLTGGISGSNGSPASNYTINFTPSQWFFVAGTGVVVNTTSQCSTSVDGSVVGLPNPNSTTTITPTFSGTLPVANYYVEYTFYQTVGATTYETLPSPEQQAQLTSTGSLIVTSPAGGIPALATGMRVYIGTASGTETLQGSTTGTASFNQSTPLASGAAVPASNSTQCRQVANDAGWPTGTGYNVALTDSSGNSVPGYPMMWQILGPGATINLSNGLPYFHGTVTYPSPIVASPQNHAAQSISGPLSLSGYNISNVGRLGVGTANPAWGVDVESGGLINAAGGYLYNGGATNGHCLVGNGTAFVDNVCPSTTPTLFYQTIQAATVAQTQRSALNFSSRFTLSDSASPSRTTVDVNATGTESELVSAATSGTNQNCAMWDANGGITDSGVKCAGAIVVEQAMIVNSGICTTGTSAYAQCTGSASNWPLAFADSNYAVTCTGVGSMTGNVTQIWAATKTTTGITISLQNGSASGAVASTWSEVDCIGRHL